VAGVLHAEAGREAGASAGSAPSRASACLDARMTPADAHAAAIKNTRLFFPLLLFVPPLSIAVPFPHIKGADPVPCLERGTVRTHQEARRRGRARSGASPCIRFLVEIDGFVRSVLRESAKSNQSMGFGSLRILRSSFHVAVPSSPRTGNAALQRREHFIPVGGWNASLKNAFEAYGMPLRIYVVHAAFFKSPLEDNATKLKNRPAFYGAKAGSFSGQCAAYGIAQPADHLIRHFQHRDAKPERRDHAAAGVAQPFGEGHLRKRREEHLREAERQPETLRRLTRHLGKAAARAHQSGRTAFDCGRGLQGRAGIGRARAEERQEEEKEENSDTAV
jgi:hypothetical protein